MLLTRTAPCKSRLFTRLFKQMLQYKRCWNRSWEWRCFSDKCSINCEIYKLRHYRILRAISLKLSIHPHLGLYKLIRLALPIYRRHVDTDHIVQWGALMGKIKMCSKTKSFKRSRSLCYDSESYSCETIRKTTLALEN